MPARLLADENIARLTVLDLRRRGFDVAAVAELFPSATDREVLALAREQGRWLVTYDRDYGDLIFRQGSAAPWGVLYLRLVPTRPDEPAEMIAAILDRFGDQRLFVAVGRRAGIRVRPLPPDHVG
ncbi:DUF5615 family PIN-like protein [Dokdonella soli]|uniref:DUF5615 domain-containing protein n=1 Tax=Dokdonella soli TaxID=529810 RepID=A0ABP3U1V5_9GAMM